MKHTMVPVLALGLLSGLLVAQEAAAGRGSVKHEGSAGMISIDYGRPMWQDEFADQLKTGNVWRLGKDDPTSMTTTCGLKAGQKMIPPGSYKLGVKKVSDTQFDLIVYEGDFFYEAGLPTYEIAPASMDVDADPKVSPLTIAFNKDNHLEVKFGPWATTYNIECVKANSYETTFAGTTTKINVLNLPLPKTVKNFHVGNAVASASGMSITWNMYLTVDGDEATLAFDSGRKSIVEKQTVSLKKQIDRIAGFMEDADDDRKEALTAFLEKSKKDLAKQETEVKQLARFKEHTETKGETTSHDEKTDVLGFATERPEGGLVLKFTTADKVATFHISPRSDFMAPRNR